MPSSCGFEEALLTSSAQSVTPIYPYDEAGDLCKPCVIMHASMRVIMNECCQLQSGLPVPIFVALGCAYRLLSMHQRQALMSVDE